MKVSVAVFAYNHEAYIEQAVRSVLAQRASFDYEIIIGEDHSTDRTLDILLHLQEQYPDRIRVLTTDHNLGMIQNSIRLLDACQGEYVALLDGDDYWCAEDKLQKQVDFLDLHPDFVICFHSVFQVDENGTQQPKILRPPEGKDVFELRELITSNFIPTGSAVLRNGLIGQFPDWVYSLNLLDWLIFILAAEHGKIKFIDEAMGIYRVHPLGFWSSMEPMKRLVTYIRHFDNLKAYLGSEYAQPIQSSLDRYWRKIMDLLYEQAILQGSDQAALKFIEENYTLLKDSPSLPPDWKSELLERAYCFYLMDNYEQGKYPAAWSAWLGLMEVSPDLLRNRGLFLIGMESVFNARLQPLARRFRRPHKTQNG